MSTYHTRMRRGSGVVAPSPSEQIKMLISGQKCQFQGHWHFVFREKLVKLAKLLATRQNFLDKNLSPSPRNFFPYVYATPQSQEEGG